ncbi:hypothetical protein MAPG_08741 [Magnaporthiopsis poae ATCC 64411]|uniref:Uncharacterized protein n=1 Tax=Magnaporthiopsis poae (strain ATCC 64411 / 73-15) TaxID=644358 RepID=A0A0C4E853_MAGP6|nr:hypothetical protein MAPG_08741 [Magnaporthiopsis poae ATCC 64411]
MGTNKTTILGHDREGAGVEQSHEVAGADGDEPESAGPVGGAHVDVPQVFAEPVPDDRNASALLLFKEAPLASGLRRVWRHLRAENALGVSARLLRRWPS